MASAPLDHAVLVRAVTLRAALLTGAAAAALLVAAPAHAAGPADLQVEVSPDAITLVPGDAERALTITVTNRGPGEATRPVLTVGVPLYTAGVTVLRSSPMCAPDPTGAILRCTLESLPADATAEISVTLAPPDRLPDLRVRSEQVTVSARDLGPAAPPPSAGRDASLTATIGEQSDEPVDHVAGTVLDGSSGDPVSKAEVTIRDADGNEQAAETDDAGRFRYDAGDGKPLRPGRVEIKVAKRGYAPSATVVRAEPGQRLDDVQLAVTPEDLAAVANGKVSADRALSDRSQPSAAQAALLIALALSCALAFGGALTWRRRAGRRQPAPESSETSTDAGLDLVAGRQGSGR